MGAGIMRRMFLGQPRTHSSERPGIPSRWQQYHGFVATPIHRIPYPDVGNRKIAPEQRAFAVSRAVFVNLGIFSREQRRGIEISAELVLLPRAIPVRLTAN